MIIAFSPSMSEYYCGGPNSHQSVFGVGCSTIMGISGQATGVSVGLSSGTAVALPAFDSGIPQNSILLPPHFEIAYNFPSGRKVTISMRFS